jgi:hypothetical protein
MNNLEKFIIKWHRRRFEFYPCWMLRNVIRYDHITKKIEASKELLRRKSSYTTRDSLNLRVIIQYVSDFRLEATEILLCLRPSKDSIYLIIFCVPELAEKAAKQLICSHELNFYDVQYIKEYVPELWPEIKNMFIIDNKKAS